MTTEQLPRIIQFVMRRDSGEFGNDNCAHCGAKGRYQWVFVCDDGKQHRAMAGCIKLYPVAPVAKIHQTLIEKAKQMAGQHWPNGDAKQLNSWDTVKLDAIEAFYRGEVSEEIAMQAIHNENVKRDNWMSKKGYRR